MVEHRSDVLDHFPGNLVPTFKSKEDLLYLVNNYLSNNSERERLAKIAHDLAWERHLFKNRAKYICDIIAR